MQRRTWRRTDGRESTGGGAAAAAAGATAGRCCIFFSQQQQALLLLLVLKVPPLRCFCYTKGESGPLKATGGAAGAATGPLEPHTQRPKDKERTVPFAYNPSCYQETA